MQSSALSVPSLARQPGEQVALRPRFIFRTMRRGVAFAALRSRVVRLDADAYLILDADEPCLVRHDSYSAAEMTTVAVGENDCAAAWSLGACNSPDAEVHRVYLRSGHLFSSESDVGRRLQRIAETRASGRTLADERDDRIALVRESAAQYAALRLRAEQLGCVKPATRESLLQRILTASDFIATHYDEAISLDEMARAASLSRFHFVRLFRLVHAQTPHAFLLRKRTAVARRRLAEGDGPGEAAARAGFGSRSTMFRNLCKSNHAAASDPTCCHSA